MGGAYVLPLQDKATIRRADRVASGHGVWVSRSIIGGSGFSCGYVEGVAIYRKTAGVGSCASPARLVRLAQWGTDAGTCSPRREGAPWPVPFSKAQFAYLIGWAEFGSPCGLRRLSLKSCSS